MAAPESPPPDRSLLIAQRNARSYSGMLIRVKQMSVRSMLHDDKMLSWIAGLMGAGLLALPTVVDAARSVKPIPRLFLVAAPWALGVLFAVAGRIVSGKHRDADDRFYTSKLSALRTLLLSDADDFEFRRRYTQIVNDQEGPLKGRRDEVTRIRSWAHLIFYGTIATFAVGVIAVYVRISFCSREVTMTRWFELIGLFVGFVGALLLTISQKADPNTGSGRPNGEVQFIVLEYPRLWKWGLFLLLAGFLVQFVSLFCATLQ